MAETTRIDFKQLYTAILIGELDDRKEDIFRAFKERNKMIGLQNAAMLETGCRVRLKGLSPKSLNGLEGVLSKIERHRNSTIFTVELDASWRGSQSVRVHPTCVEPLE